MRNQRIQRCVDLLAAAGVQAPRDAPGRLEQHLRLVREMNEVVRVVSSRDAGQLVESHLVDSLSLAPYIRELCADEGVYLDIGSGGGFPALPIAVVLPECHVCMVERSSKKAGFLRKVLGALSLDNVEIVVGDFPEAIRRSDVRAMVARGVEKPERVAKGIVPFLESGAVFLCQHPSPERMFPDEFHVERIEDEWTRLGLRRGSLHRVTCGG